MAKERLPIGTLVAVTGLNPNLVVCIGRIAGYNRGYVIVESDEEIEGEAAIEHDFDTPEPRRYIVEENRIRLIKE